MVAIIALVVGLALLTVVAFLWPVLVMAALAGLMLGLLVRAFARLLKGSRRARVASLGWGGAIVVGVVVVGLTIMGIPRMTSVRHIGLEPVYVHVPYSGVATLAQDDGDWEIEDQTSISKDDFKLPMESKLPVAQDTQLESLFGRIVHNLGQQGWKTAGFVDGRVRLIRTRHVTAPSRWFPARTVGPIPLDFGGLGEDDFWIRLVPAENAILNLQVPKYTVASTYPPATQRVDQLQDDRERITVPVGSSLTVPEGLEVRVAILSPLLRWRIGFAFAKFSPATALLWIIGFLFYVFAEEVKKNVLTPVAKRVLIFLGVKYTP